MPLGNNSNLLHTRGFCFPDVLITIVTNTQKKKKTKWEWVRMSEKLESRTREGNVIRKKKISDLYNNKVGIGWRMECVVIIFFFFSIISKQNWAVGVVMDWCSEWNIFFFFFTNFPEIWSWVVFFFLWIFYKIGI